MNPLVMLFLLLLMALILVVIPFFLVPVFPSEFSKIGLFKWLSFFGLFWNMLSAVMLIMSDVLGLRQPVRDKRFITRLAFTFLFAGFGLQFLALLLS
jgi:hypothetical protein